VADYLFASGFTILGRNVRLGALEIDVVARRGSLIVVVEVRTRSPRAWVPAFASVGRDKRTRLLAATDRLWRTRLHTLREVTRVRIDVAAVSFEGGRTLVHYAPGVLAR